MKDRKVPIGLSRKPVEAILSVLAAIAQLTKCWCTTHALFEVPGSNPDLGTINGKKLYPPTASYATPQSDGRRPVPPPNRNGGSDLKHRAKQVCYSFSLGKPFLTIAY